MRKFLKLKYCLGIESNFDHFFGEATRSKNPITSKKRWSRRIRMDGPIRSKVWFLSQIIYDSKSPIPNIGENYIDPRLIGDLQASWENSIGKLGSASSKIEKFNIFFNFAFK